MPALKMSWRRKVRDRKSFYRSATILTAIKRYGRSMMGLSPRAKIFTDLPGKIDKTPASARLSSHFCLKRRASA
jgi:hypothetical protein